MQNLPRSFSRRDESLNHGIEPLEARIAPANLAFAISGGGVKDQRVLDVGVDAAGNTYVAGTFLGTVDFDLGPGVTKLFANNGISDNLYGGYTRGDVFVAKYTSTGALAWVNRISVEGAVDEGARRIEMDVAPNGDVFVLNDFGISGDTNGTNVQFFEGSMFVAGASFNQVGTDIQVYLAKYDTTGHIVWTTHFAGAAGTNVTAGDIKTDGNGGVFFAGSLTARSSGGTLTLGSATITADPNEDNLFVAKLQDGATPTVVWATSPSSPGTVSHFDDELLTVDKTTGNVSIGGTFGGTVIFPTSLPTTLTAPDAFDTFIAQVDGTGAWRFAGVFATGGVGVETSADVAADGLGNVYLVGSFKGTADLDPSAGVATVVSVGGVNKDGFIAKIDPAGALIYVHTFGGTADDGAALPIVGNDGSVHFAVLVSDGLVDVDAGAGVFPVDAVGNNARAVIVTETAGGVFVDALVFNGTISPTGDGLFIADAGGGFGFALDAAGGLHLGGTLVHSLNVNLSKNGPDVRLVSKGGSDFFIAQYFPGDLVGQTLQQPGVTRAFTIGGAGDESVQDGKTDAAGNIYLTGLFRGTIDFDPDPIPAHVVSFTSAGADPDAFIAKYSPAGALIWARPIPIGLTFDTNANDVALRLGLDDLGNAYITGEYDVSATLGSFVLTNSNPTPTGSARDIFVAKLDAGGTFLWAKSFGGAGGNEFVDGFAVEGSTGKVVLGGTFASTVDFDPAPGPVFNPVSNGQSDGFYLELDAAGTFRWVRQFGGNSASLSPHNIDFASNGDVIAAGFFRGTIDFNLGGAADLLASNAGNDDILVMRLKDSDGGVVWRQAFGGAADDEGRGVAVNAADEIFVTGAFRGGVDFDPGVGKTILVESGGDPSNGSGDVFLLKLAGGGGFLNAVGFGRNESDHGEQVLLGAGGAVYVAGQSGLGADLDPGPGVAQIHAKGNFFSRFDGSTLGFHSAFVIETLASDGGPQVGFTQNGGFVVDPAGKIFFAGSFLGSTDVDPSRGVKTFKSKGGQDIALVELSSANLVDAANPRSFNDANGDLVTIALSGPGTAEFSLVGDVAHLADLKTLALSGTTLATTVTVSVTGFGSGNGATFVQKIGTTQPLQHVGAIDLDGSVTLGDGVLDTVADLHVSGALKSLTLGDLAANTIVRLGDDLPYNFAADKTTPDTYNNRPALTIGHVLGAGVSIDVLNSTPSPGPGLPAPTGGGGLGNVIIGSWNFPGLIRTTQSIGNITVLNDDAGAGTPGVFRGVIEVDRFHVGEATMANVGVMTFVNGSWGSTGTVIEGNVTAFNAEAFLAGATIDAGSLGKVTTGRGNFAGTITLTNVAAAGTSTFTVASNFTGKLISNSPLKKLNVRGNFTGSLSAPSIAGITAFSFDGTETGGVNDTSISATKGALGTLKTLSGVFKNYDLVTTGKFAGIDVKLSKLRFDTVAIDNVHITAASIGNLNVALTASPTATGVDFIGIRNSSFVATGATGIVATIGKITVNLAGQDGSALGIDHASFTGKTIDATSVTVGHRVNFAADVRALDATIFRAGTALGAITLAGDATGPQATALIAVSGGTIGAINVKAKNPVFGSLLNSTVLAGQALAFAGNDTAAMTAAKLRGAALGAVTLTGSLTGSLIAAGSNIGALTIGEAVTSSNIFAGALLGADLAFDGVGDSFQHAAAIASITVKKGGFVLSSALAGIDPVDGALGNADDKIALAGPATATGSIGPIKIAAGLNTPFNPAGTASHVIEAAHLKSLALPGQSPFVFTLDGALLDNSPVGQDLADILVRLRA